MSTDKSTSNVEQAKTKYEINEVGQIYRTDKVGQRLHLATLRDGAIVYVNENTKKYHPVVVRYLNDEKIEFDNDKTTTEGTSQESPYKPDQIPPAPKKSPKYGDKTPEYVEWLKKYYPERYNERYGIRGPGVVTKVREGVDPKTGRPIKIRYKQEAIISKRKTHITEKAEGALGHAEDEE